MTTFHPGRFRAEHARPDHLRPLTVDRMSASQWRVYDEVCDALAAAMTRLHRGLRPAEIDGAMDRSRPC